ncbi:Uncharacterised protein [Mycobacteroides abscessus subsp. abscessus]|nr:Uncharacterised protein [Mycobacteroides abscessus subsp. abscessus]
MGRERRVAPSSRRYLVAMPTSSQTRPAPATAAPVGSTRRRELP